MTRRVTYLISDFEGGTAHHLLSVAEHLAEKTWSPWILNLDPGAPVSVLDDTVEMSTYRRPPWFHRFPVAQLRELAWTWKRLQSGRQTLVHTYFYWPIVYGRILKALGVIDILVENREDEGFDWSQREYRVLRATRSLPDRVIAVSESVREVVLEREGIAGDRVVTVHNAIPTPPSPSETKIAQLRNRWDLADADPIIGYVGNFERPIKGLRYLIETVPLVRDQLPNVAVVVVGRGPDRYLQQAADLGVAEVIRFTGPTRDVHAFYQLFDVSVLPSLSEGLSLTLLESMAHGLPVVVTAVGGNPEVVEHGKTGFLVPPRDPPALAEKLVVVASNRSLLREMGERGRDRAVKKFLQPAAAEKYGRLYRNLEDAAT